MVRLMSLNVERSGHLDRFVPFVRQFAPDILCLQELMESDVPAIIAGTAFSEAHFAAMARHSDAPVETPFGVGIFSRAPIEAPEVEVYAGDGDGMMVLDRRTPETRVATTRYVLARATCRFDGFAMALATTHFPWTHNGLPSDFQFAALDRLIALIGDRPIVLTGDFNAPRGGPLFDRLAAHLTDNIPANVTTTIDPELHRAGALELVVDGLFTSPHYQASDVSVHPGLSDHQAVTGVIEAAPETKPRPLKRWLRPGFGFHRERRNARNSAGRSSRPAG
jgi:endonuclease/exonuclease/phosphatase family metal-dependent hydrolase